MAYALGNPTRTQLSRALTSRLRCSTHRIYPSNEVPRIKTSSRRDASLAFASRIACAGVFRESFELVGHRQRHDLHAPRGRRRGRGRGARNNSARRAPHHPVEIR
jgi:hypothetical protein